MELRGRFDDELADLHAAHEWALAGSDPALVVSLTEALLEYWIASGRLVDGIKRAEPVGRREDLDARQRARVAVAIGRISYHLTDWQRATSQFEEALSLVGDEPADSEVAAIRAMAQCFLGACIVVTGDHARGSALAREALDGARRHQLYAVEVASLSVLAIGAIIGGDPVEERHRYEERLITVRRRGDRARIADTLNTLAEIALDEGELETATALADESLALSLGIMPPEARDALITLARACAANRDLDAARARLASALDLCEQTGQTLGVSQCLRVGGCIAVAEGDARSAVRLFAAAHAVQPSLSGTEEPVEADLAACLAAARSALSAAMQQTEWSLGLSLPPDEMVSMLRRLLSPESAEVAR
jgi:tetratricopeptide (TPR) repeat protein